MLEPGSLLGKYRIIHPIGTGGFATVYLGEHLYLKTLAAVKVLRFGPDVEQEGVKRFLHEARTVAALKHPHIVSILDFGIEENIPCLVMDYAPNGSLRTRHERKQIVDLKMIILYTKQIAEALQFAHDRQVIHCDVKPENMLLDQHNNILLSDFGIAIVLHASFKMSTVMGTLHYMAPEQFLGNPVPASDQYALAVVIYHWLCGQFPFNGRDAFEIAHLQKSVLPRPLRQINPQVPHEIEHVVLSALSQDPDQRFSNVSAFANALEKAMVPKRHILPATSASLPSAIVAKKRTSLAAEPSMPLPSLTSLLPSSDKRNMQRHPLPLPPNGPGEVTHTAPISPIQDARQSVLPQQNGTMNMLNNEAKPEILLPLPSTLLPTVLPFHAATTTRLTYRQHTAWVSAIAWSPDGGKLASASWDKTVHIWDALDSKTIFIYRGHTQPVKSITWSPDGGYIASGAWDNGVQVWDTEWGIALPEVYKHDEQVEAVAWSPDGVCIASAGQDGYVHIWRVSNKRTLLIYKEHKGPVWSLAWSPNGKYIASASHDGTVQVWEALTGKIVQIYHGHKRQVAVVAWSYDGHLIASGDHDGWVHIWNHTNGDMLLHYHDIQGSVKALNWSPCSMRLASAVKSVQVWHLASPLPTTPSFTYTGHTDWINGLTWSPNGQQIATASDDKTIQIWDVR